MQYPEDKEVRKLWWSEVMRSHDKTGRTFLQMEKQYEGYYWYEMEEN